MATIGVFAVLCNEASEVLCVRQGYAPHLWTLPGGRVEPNESPLDALYREIGEETGYRVRIESFVGCYALPPADDLVLMFRVTALGRRAWRPNGEIAALGFFAADELPEPMNRRTRLRIGDALAGRSGLVRVFDHAGDLLAGWPES